MENTRDYRYIDLVDDETQAEKLTKQPSYRAHHIFHDNLIAVERYQTSAKMDKPIYTGMYLIYWSFVSYGCKESSFFVCIASSTNFMHYIVTVTKW